MGARIRTRILLIAVITIGLLLGTSRGVGAQERLCEGPGECCPLHLDPDLKDSRTVAVGVVLVGLSNIAERPGTWDADYYLYESWKPEPGFTPQTELTNEAARGSQQFDNTELRDGRCIRSRRIRSTIRNAYNLRTFPFDHQTLSFRFSDEQYDTKKVSYATSPLVIGIDGPVRTQVSGWKIETDMAYEHGAESFRWEEGAPDYAYAQFGLKVRRHITFHLTKFFLPLLIIVVVSFSVFWIDPDDLSSEISVGVTCLLAAIALQWAEGQTLPEVDYLTLADRVYATCYSLIGTAILQSVYTNRLARLGRKDQALRIDRKARWLFPGALAVVLVLVTVRAYTQT